MQQRHQLRLVAVSSILIFALLIAQSPPSDAKNPGRAATACDCDLENKLVFLSLIARVREHSVPTTYTISTVQVCPIRCLVFDEQYNENGVVPQGNWSIERNGVIRFEHRPHKTGEAQLGITIQEAAGDSDYIANVTYRIVIQEDPDVPFVFASQNDVAIELGKYNDVTKQFRNASLTVEQNTGNNTAYADLLFTAGVFDYDADETIRVRVDAGDAARKGSLSGLEVNSSQVLLDPSDCNETEEVRLADRNLTRWDVELLGTHPCDLETPYPASELSWFAHLARYRPKIGQSGVDLFALTFTDKYRLEAKLFVNVHILQNPCINGGRCRGPTEDPLCTGVARASGFFDLGYRCRCETGWVGDRCHVDFDDCSSSPCPAPYVCRDKLRGFDCVCPNNLVNCRPLLAAWQLATILLGAFSVVCIVAAILVVASQQAPVVVGAMPKESAETTAELVPEEPAIEAFQMEEQKEEEKEVEEEEPVVTAVVEFADEGVQAVPELAEAATTEMPQWAAKETQKEEKEEEEEPQKLQLGYRRSFKRSSILIRPGVVPQQSAQRLDEEEAWSRASSDIDMQRMRRRSVEEAAREAELQRFAWNRKALNDF